MVTRVEQVVSIYVVQELVEHEHGPLQDLTKNRQYANSTGVKLAFLSLVERKNFCNLLPSWKFPLLNFGQIDETMYSLVRHLYILKTFSSLVLPFLTLCRQREVDNSTSHQLPECS